MTTQHNIPAKKAERADLAESYADTIRGVWFDGTWRIEADVTRLDATSTPMTATQYPSCRLVLSAAAGLALLERLNQLAKELEANGTLQRSPVPQPGVTH